MQNILLPIGFVGEKRTPAYFKSQIMDYLYTLESIDTDEVYRDKWLNNETVLIIDNEGCETPTNRQLNMEEWSAKWMKEINDYINL